VACTDVRLTQCNSHLKVQCTSTRIETQNTTEAKIFAGEVKTRVQKTGSIVKKVERIVSDILPLYIVFV
jgi:hypothetical protein